MDQKKTKWIDAEVHLLPPKWCQDGYLPPSRENKMIQTIYKHPEGPLALSKATCGELLKEMDRSGIDFAVIMGMPWNDPEMCWENNKYISDIVQKYPDKFIGLGILPDPHLEAAEESVKKITYDFGFKGVKIIPSWHSYSLDSPIFNKALEIMANTGIVLVPHTDHLFVDPKKSDTAFKLLKTAKRFPELKIMAPHLGGLLCLYGLHEPIKTNLTNILFITSVSATMKMTEFAVHSVGSDNIAFGTDFPFNSTHDQKTVRTAVENLNFDQDTIDKISGANTANFLGLAI